MSEKTAKFMKIGIIIFSSLLILYVLIGVLLPVNFDAGACGGGYPSYLAKQDHNNFNALISEQLGNYEMVSTTDQIAENLDWSGHTITTNMKVKADNKIYEVYLKGRRYWYERYSWNIDKINKLTD